MVGEASTPEGEVKRIQMSAEREDPMLVAQADSAVLQAGWMREESLKEVGWPAEN